MITKQDLLDLRELIQDDLICVLDGQEDRLVDNACQVVVDRMKPLWDKLKDGGSTA